MTICKKCGSDYDESFNLCPFCGTRFEPPAMAPPSPSPVPVISFPPPDSPRPSMTIPSEKKKKNSKAPLIILVIVLAVVVIGAAVTVVLLVSLSQTRSAYSEQISLGEKYLSAENYDEAIKAFNKAIDIDPNNPEPYKLLADAYLGKGKTPQAIAALELGYERTGDPSIKKKLDTLRSLEVVSSESSDSTADENSGSEHSPSESSPDSASSEENSESGRSDIFATIYFIAPENWEDVYAYVYDKNDNKNDAFGIEMTLVDASLRKYCYQVPAHSYDGIEFDEPGVVFKTRTESVRATKRNYPMSGYLEIVDGMTYSEDDNFVEESSKEESSKEESSKEESSKAESSKEESSKAESSSEESSKTESSSSGATDWKSLYKEKIKAFRESDNALKDNHMFELLDVDGNGIPELFLSESFIHFSSCRCYLYHDGTLVEGPAGCYGELYYCQSKKMILSINGGQGNWMYRYYHLDSTGFVQDISFEVLGSYPELSYTIDGQDVTKDEYNEKKKKYDSFSWVSVGRKTNLTDSDIDAELSKW